MTRHTATCVFVAGMHRSGTSLVAGLLATHWGGAPRTLLVSALGNETGHWEPKRLIVFNELLLKTCGTTWDDASPFPPLCEALGADVLAQYREKAGQLLLEELNDRPRLVFKDPRLCRLLPFWLDVAEDCGLRSQIVHPLRHPVEVAASLDARNGTSEGYAVLLWLRHMLDAERASRDRPRAFLTYDEVLDDWEATNARLRNALALTDDASLGRDRESGAVAEEVLRRHDLRHHRATREDEERLAPEILQAYRLFEKTARSGHDPNPATLARLQSWLDSDALTWNVISQEIVARRTILETWSETPDTLRKRLKDEEDAFGPFQNGEVGEFGGVPRRLLPLEIRDISPSRSEKIDWTSSVPLVTQLAEERLRETLNALETLQNSRSWTLTRPLREGGRAIRRVMIHPAVRGLHWTRVAIQRHVIEPIRQHSGRVQTGLHKVRSVTRNRLVAPSREMTQKVQSAAWGYLAKPSPQNADLARYMDVAWYQAHLPHTLLKVHPTDHYADMGYREDRWPAPWFDPKAYRREAKRRHADLATDADPFAHFVREGAKQGIIGAPEGAHDVAIAIAADIVLGPALPKGWRVEGILDLRIEDNAFRATGADPQILINPGRTLPAGIHEISLRYFGSDRLMPTLYFDVGKGFWHELSTVMLPEGRRRNACIVDLPARARRLRLDPFEEADRPFGVTAIATRHVPLIDLLSDRVRRRMGQVEEAPVPVSLRDRLLGRPRPFSPTQPATENPELLYQRWIALFDDDTEHMGALRTTIEAWPDRPTVSVLMPVYNPPEALLDAAIRSVVDQVYPDWELCIANDASTDPHVAPVLDRWAARDDRIRVVHRPENGHISHASNSALELATGEWLALLDHDDVLRPHALAEAMLAVRGRPEAGLIYSDEDKIDDDGIRFSPFFKPDFSPDLLRSQNYLNHLTVHRTEHVRAVGGWRPGYEGSQDYDLNLRVMARLEPGQVVHVPKVLYHWRATAGSTAAKNDAKGYAYEAGLKALRDALSGDPSKRVEGMSDVPFYRTVHTLPDPAPKVTLVIPTKDRRDLLERCVSTILDGTDYPSFDVIVVDNASSEPDTLAYLDTIDALPNVRVLRHPHPFNYSEINNRAVAEAKGDIIGLVNNDIEVIHPGWMREMAAQAQPARDRLRRRQALLSQRHDPARRRRHGRRRRGRPCLDQPAALLAGLFRAASRGSRRLGRHRRLPLRAARRLRGGRRARRGAAEGRLQRRRLLPQGP